MGASHGFFARRRELNLDLGDGIRGLKEYQNLPRAIGAVLSSRMATLRELETYYGAEDLCRMLEVLATDAHNQRAVNEYGNRNR